MPVAVDHFRESGDVGVGERDVAVAMPDGQLEFLAVDAFGDGEVARSVARPVGEVGEQRAGVLEEWVEAERAGGVGLVEFGTAFGVKRSDEVFDG